MGENTVALVLSLISSHKQWKMNILDTRPNIEICKLQLWNFSSEIWLSYLLNDTMDQYFVIAEEG